MVRGSGDCIIRPEKINAQRGGLAELEKRQKKRQRHGKSFPQRRKSRHTQRARSGLTCLHGTLGRAGPGPSCCTTGRRTGPSGCRSTCRRSRGSGCCPRCTRCPQNRRSPRRPRQSTNPSLKGPTEEKVREGATEPYAGDNGRARGGERKKNETKRARKHADIYTSRGRGKRERQIGLLMDESKDRAMTPSPRETHEWRSMLGRENGDR